MSREGYKVPRYHPDLKSEFQLPKVFNIYLSMSPAVNPLRRDRLDARQSHFYEFVGYGIY